MAKESLVIVGTGWAGYTLSQKLDDKKYDITIISPEDTSPYTPLLASAACGLFDFSLAEEPVRHKHIKLEYYQARVESVDFERKVCTCRPAVQTNGVKADAFEIGYDRLVLAPGCVTNTFNTPGVEEYGYFVRNVNDAKRVQRQMRALVERASIPGLSDEQQRALLHIVIVGGGPTGVELSAEMSDLFSQDYSTLYPKLRGKMRISLHDAGHEILGNAFEASLREYAMASFTKRGVEIVTDSRITEVGQDSIATKKLGHQPCGMVIWATGNKICPLVEKLDVAKAKAGMPRIQTDACLRVKATDGSVMQDVFALGDAADVEKQSLPTTAEVAVQKAEYLASALNRSDFSQPFEYRQKALVAYIGGHDGVVSGKPTWSGAEAWAAWRSKNLLWTRSWRRKVMIMANWVLDLINGKEIARA
ncbi:hypothetical protein CDD82_4327 [Ophiocordyceps australis]|uniref:FAD/NAD(P)-binding domain-containing protein n=1 Tax=Ophiocordyceps australis TaxID=1399860 RepID=A0A2C5Z937_9HYPO|nr:hypothetical protein CDD82_4327 [Ophiocordyceps australis]